MIWVLVDFHCIANGHDVKLPYKYLCLCPVYCLSLGHRGSYVLCVKNDAAIHEWTACSERLTVYSTTGGSMIPTCHPRIKDHPKTWKRM